MDHRLTASCVGLVETRSILARALVQAAGKSAADQDRFLKKLLVINPVSPDVKAIYFGLRMDD